MIRPFFRRYGRLRLAQILLDEDPIVAGKIAAEEYERLLGIASQHVETVRYPVKKELLRGLSRNSRRKGISGRRTNLN